MIFPCDKIGSYRKCFQEGVNGMRKIQQIMLSEKIGCEFVCVGRSPFWHDIVMDKWIMQSLPKSLLWSAYPSPAAVTPAADSSQLHPSLGIVLGPRKQTHPKLAPPGSQWLADEGIQRPTHLLPFGTTLKGHPTSSAKSQWHLHLQSNSPPLPLPAPPPPRPLPPHFPKGCLQTELTQ